MTDTTSAVSEFGAWLVRARGEAGLTQDELSAETGVHVNTIKNLESGKTKRPRAEVAANLRARLGAQVTHADVSAQVDQHTKSIVNLIEAYLMALPEEKRLERIFDLARYLLTEK